MWANERSMMFLWEIEGHEEGESIEITYIKIVPL